MLAALHNHKIQVLDLQDNTFTLQGSLACVDALKAWQQQQSLLELNIGECLLGAAGSIHILRALAGTHSKLTRLLCKEDRERVCVRNLIFFI